MIREILRRLLWLTPTLAVVTVLAFWAIARNLPPAPGEEGMPLLFNANPTSVDTLAWDAARAATKQGPAAAQAADLLVRLGGATLPHLLPGLDTLDPSDRRRVALSLLPIAERMRILEPGEIVEGEAASRFWSQFWQNHFVDFKPTVVRRVVKRFSKRSTPLRRDELLQLDTYALDELLEQMSSKYASQAAIRRLSAAAAHIAQKPWIVPSKASPEEAAKIVEQWQAWWARHQPKYTASQGIERLVAPILQTRYALWAREAARTRFGRLGGHQSAFSELIERSSLTLWLLGIALLGGTLLGTFAGALVTTALPPRHQRWETLGGLLWVSVPVAIWVGFAPVRSETGREIVASLLALILGSVVAIRQQRSAWRRISVAFWTRITQAHEPLLMRRAWVVFRASTPSTIASMAAHASALVGSVFLIEYGLGLGGIGERSIEAVLQQDVTWLMLVAVVSTLFLGLLQVVASTLGDALDPSTGEARHG